MTDKPVLIEYNHQTLQFILPDSYESFTDICSLHFSLSKQECSILNIQAISDSGDTYIIHNNLEYTQFYSIYKISNKVYNMKIKIEDREIQKKLERKRRILDKINNKVNDYIKQSKIEKNEVENEIVDNSNDYNERLKDISKKAENEIREKMIRLLEVEKIHLRENLVSKLTQENKNILNSVTNQLNQIENQRQKSMISEVSKISQQNNTIVHKGIQCMLCLMYPIYGKRYQCS